MTIDLQRFRDKLLIEAIIIVEGNDYMGLLVEKAKMLIQSEGRPFDHELLLMLFNDITNALTELESYRKLNLCLQWTTMSNVTYNQRYFERYFKSRIISAKRILSRLCKFIAPSHLVTVNSSTRLKCLKVQQLAF